MAASPSTKKQGAYRKTVLNDGLRVLTEQMPAVRSVTLGVWVDVGSRNESLGESGVSHLIEHMLFKGTPTRNARDIAAAIESIGGVFNAFTSRENTCFVVRIMDEHLPIAVDVLSDMLSNSSLSPINLKREKKVICEEIKESVDNPSDQIHDLFATTYWGDHPLGRPILGTEDNVTNMPRRIITGYINRHYRSGSVVVAACGSVSHNKLVKLVRDKFHFSPGVSEPAQPSERDNKSRLVLKPDKNNQTHLCLGYPGVTYAADEKIAALLLNMHLGGGMSSVLFQKIRELKGLAYSVYSYLDFYRDAGLFGAYIGTDSTHLKQALDIMLFEFKRMKTKRLSVDMLDKIKNQLKGNIMLGMESTSARMNRLGRHELMYGEYYPLSRTLKEIDRVTVNDIIELARRIFDDSQMAIAVLGPSNKSDFAHVI